MNTFATIVAAAEENLFTEPTMGQVVLNLAIFLTIPALLIFQLIMFIHCLIKPVQHKVVWVLVLIFVPFLGGLLYFFMGRKYQAAQPNANAQVNPPTDMTPQV